MRDHAAALVLLAERAPQLLDDCGLNDDGIFRPERALSHTEALALLQAWQLNNGVHYDERATSYLFCRLTITKAEANRLSDEWWAA